MTAEIAILNPIGVALAADSAVTIGSDARKIYTSADKLFHLANSAPIGVMIYGSATLNGVPWETIIKNFRRELGSRRFDTVARYADAFRGYLNRRRDLLVRGNGDTFAHMLIVHCVRHFRDQLVRPALDEKIKSMTGGNISPRQISGVLADVVSNRIREIRTAERIVGFDASVRRRIVRQFGKVVSASIDEVFGNMPMRDATRAAMVKLPLEILSRKIFGPGLSGLVFAGFGEKELTPSIVSKEIEGVVANRLRCRDSGAVNIVPYKNTASIIPFAQKEMVTAFMEGMDVQLHGHVTNSTNKAFRDVIEAVLERVNGRDSKLARELGSIIRPNVDKVLKELNAGWKEEAKKIWQPIVEIVATLPKDELAAMAEALVDLTKFKRRVTPTKETVGGPIDVAIITKGDGFVWIKRKHYFDPALNPRVIGNMHRGG